MFTSTKSRTVGQTPIKRSRTPGEKRMRKDRMIALVALVIVTGIMAAVMWLASMSDAPINTDYWPMMP